MAPSSTAIRLDCRLFHLAKHAVLALHALLPADLSINHFVRRLGFDRDLRSNPREPPRLLSNGRKLALQISDWRFTWKGAAGFIDT